MAAFIDISEISVASAAPSTAFPYSVLPPMIKPRVVRSSGHSCRHIVRCLFQLLIMISITIFFVAIFPYLMDRNLDSPENPRFLVESAVAFPFNVDHSAAVLNASWDFTLTVGNPNRNHTIYYDDIQAAILYRFETSGFNGEMRYLAATSVPPFVQEQNEIAHLRFQLDAVDKFVGTAAGDQILLKRDSGSVEFELRLIARSRYMVGETQVGEKTLRVSCSPLELRFHPDEKFGYMDMDSYCKVLKSAFEAIDSPNFW